MPTSERDDAARWFLPAVLLTANLLLFAIWPWLRSLPLSADSTDPAWKVFGEGPSAERSLSAESILRNGEYLASFMDAVRKERAVLFLGTSETVPHYNLGAQLNAISPDPTMVVLAKEGTSPIHNALVFANCRIGRISMPPLVLLINPVYFTQSHDVINDGWIGLVMRSEVFVQLDHRHILESLSPEARAAYARHFQLQRALLPLYAQEYLGNLLYLVFHQDRGYGFDSESLPVPRYKFDGTIPEYDQRGVHVDSHALDTKSRWEVKRVPDSLNLKGLESIVASLENQPAPVLLLVLPVNRRFYESSGVAMPQYDERYRELRRAISSLQSSEHVFLVDLFESPWLDRGFKDRMHLDAYGFHQVAEHLTSDRTYRRFLDAVHAYYGISPKMTSPLQAAPGPM